MEEMRGTHTNPHLDTLPIFNKFTTLDNTKDSLEVQSERAYAQKVRDGDTSKSDGELHAISKWGKKTKRIPPSDRLT